MADDLRQRVAYEMEMGGLDKVNSDLQGVSSQADKSSGAVGGLSGQFALGALKAQAVAAALAFVAEALKSIPREIQAMTDLNASLFDSATRAGLLVEQYQALGYVMRQAGGSVGDAQTMIRSMNSLLNQASVETSRQRVLLDELGLSYTNLRNSDPVEAFYDITDAVGQLSTSQERNLALSELFGNRYSQIISGALNQTQGSIRNATLALEEQGLIIETDTVNAYKVYSDMQTELQARMEALKSEALLPTLPILENIIDLKMDLAERVIPKVGEAVTVLTYMLGESLEVLVSVFGALAEANNDVKLGWDSLPRSLQLLINPLAGSVEAIYEGAKAMMDADNASQQMEEAYAREAEAVRLQAIALTVMNDELALTPQLLRGMASSLSDMTLMADAAEPILQQVNERLAQCTWQTTEALGPLSQYTAQELSRAIAIRQTNVALLEQWDAMGKSGPAMQERIDRIRNEIALLKEQAASLGAATVSARGSSRTSAPGDEDPLDPKAGGMSKADAIARELSDAMAMQEEYMEGLYEYRATKEAQYQDMVMEREQTAWETRYEIGMHYSGMMASMLASEFENGFKDIDKAFGKMVTRMMSELAASGLLSWASSLLGGGPVGIFGQIFGGGK